MSFGHLKPKIDSECPLGVALHLTAFYCSLDFLFLLPFISPPPFFFSSLLLLSTPMLATMGSTKIRQILAHQNLIIWHKRLNIYINNWIAKWGIIRFIKKYWYCGISETEEIILKNELVPWTLTCQLVHGEEIENVLELYLEDWTDEELALKRCQLFQKTF